MHQVPGFVTVFAALVLFAANALALPPRYQFTDLGSLGGRDTWPTGINNAGQVVGRSRTSDPSLPQRGFLWQNGTMTALDLPGGGEGFPQDINERGQIVGTASPLDGGPGRAFVWENGQARLLPGADAYPEGGGAGGSFAVSETGAVVGNVKTSRSSSAPALWAPDGTLTLLDPGDGTANGINSLGHVVGTTGVASGQRAVLWRDGGLVDITSGRGLAVNDKGQVVGMRFAGSGSRPFIYDNGRVTDLRAVTGGLDFAQDINESGVVVGRFQPSPNVDHAFAWENGVFKDLNTLVTLQPGLTLMTAEAINDDGRIVGLFTNARGETAGYLLAPVPEPTSAALPAAASALLLRRRRCTRAVK